ncbi:dimethyladenosine transferase [Listeria weihenstephanensis]|uniref:Dimethyladenosine transferase n=1 Tax=Listeria weihenstephanensis TaxID=1006155 RepID=A0A1S7FVI9_9LIST|nr:DJ-1/PfpI family protein [Listeria weihenstephanensis]AQY51377.1 dimethyladenosine transferase [Listeria weihenstephanensis]
MAKIMMLLADGFEAVEASVFTDVLGWNEMEGGGGTELVTVGLRDRLKCTWNFTVIPEFTLGEVELAEFDALVIPGGFEEAGFYEDAYDPAFLDVIRHFDTHEKWIGTICVAALALGKAGILQGKRATTYNGVGSVRQAQLKDFGAQVQQDPIVVENHIITSHNPSTAFDVAFLVLEKLTNTENTKHVKKLMGFEK